MLITRETDYVLRVLRVLTDGERHTMKALCETEEIPQQFAYKIIRKLADADMITCTRGVNGGCQLKNDLAAYTLYDLITTINPDRYVNACMDPHYSCDWRKKHDGHCGLHNRQKEVQDEMELLLRRYRLSDMMQEDIRYRKSGK